MWFTIVRDAARVNMKMRGFTARGSCDEAVHRAARSDGWFDRLPRL
jgi:hypothetical protein